MATDKLIMTFVCLIVLGIIAVIIVAIVNKSKGKNGDGELNDFNPFPTNFTLPF